MQCFRSIHSSSLTLNGRCEAREWVEERADRGTHPGVIVLTSTLLGPQRTTCLQDATQHWLEGTLKPHQSTIYFDSKVKKCFITFIVTISYVVACAILGCNTKKDADKSIKRSVKKQIKIIIIYCFWLLYDMGMTTAKN